MSPEEKTRLENYIAERTAPGENGCLVWSLSLGSHGYPQAYDGKTNKLAHRLAYEVLVGPIPAGLQIDHLCRNKRCVNPQHLQAVTQQINIRRQFNGVETLDTCSRGHVGQLFRDTRGKPGCRTCRRISDLKYQARKAEG